MRHGGRQEEVGDGWDLLVIGSDEDGIDGARLGAPGDGDVVSGGLTEVVQFLCDDGVGHLDGAGLGERVGYGQPGGQGLFDADIGRHSSARDVDDADDRGTLRSQPVMQTAQAGALSPRPGGCVGQGAHRRGRFVDDDVVAIPTEFVVAQIRA